MEKLNTEHRKYALSYDQNKTMKKYVSYFFINMSTVDLTFPRHLTLGPFSTSDLCKHNKQN